MKQLAFSFYCPKDCDRIPETIDDADTDRVRASWKCCPKCESVNIEPFMQTPVGDAHCWDCGSVFK